MVTLVMTGGGLSYFFSWLEDEDYIIKSPVRRIHKVKTSKTIKETYTDENLELMRDNCVELRDLAMIDMLASTGMRVGEMVLLNRSNIDFNERECVVVGKGDKERLVYFNAEAEVSLREYLDSRTDDCTGLFVSKRRPFHQIGEHALENIIKKVSKRTGVEAYPHKLRHTFATAGIHSGIPLEKLQLLLGHSKPETTMIYADQDRTDVQNAYSKAYA